MIINSIIPGNRSIKIARISPSSGFSKFRIMNLGTQVQLSVSYQNDFGLSGKTILYYNGVEQSSVNIANNGSYTWNVTATINNVVGVYTFRILVIDIEGNSDFIDFVILFGFTADDFMFSYNPQLNGYVFEKFAGDETSVMIPNLYDDGTNGVKNVVRIGNGAFFNNDTITLVSIPSTVQSIGTTAFFSCNNLSNLTINGLSSTIALDSSNVFDPYNQLSLLKIYVPSGLVQSYKTAQYWSEYANSIFAIGA